MLFRSDLVLDANEAAAPPAPLAERLGVADLHRYPDASPLEALVAGHLGVAADRVLVGAGADDLLQRAVAAVCSPGREAILAVPGFAMLHRYVALAGAGVRELTWWQGEWPVDEALALADDATSLVAVVSPNNPTGATISRAALERLAASLPRALILLDHAYVEFADDDLTDLAFRLPNVVAVRTVSKAWGAAGLRVGWAVGDERVIRWMRAAGHPYPASSPSLAAVAGLLRDGLAAPAGRIGEIRRERAALGSLLESLGASPLPSQANFVLARVTDAAFARDALAALGIAIRAFAEPLLDGWIRVTVPGEPKTYRRLARSLGAALAPGAVLLDMDGVLADVSGSYREAIRATAASFGAEVEPGEISAAKAAGDAANDWVVTARLLAARGIEPPMDEVVARFEALYQGVDDRSGLRSRERPLLSPDELARIAARRPVGVVTGRPRRDAERFLAEHNLAGSVGAVVCMEDAAAKPDPAPVRLALERLGVASAWMVGDTPDDLRAARAAGVVPLGVPAPGEEPAAARRVLSAAGAARVFDTPGDLIPLLEVLP